jgi:hypothetical protein
MAWQGNSIGTAWEPHGMCELVFKITVLCKVSGCSSLRNEQIVLYRF